MSETWALFLTRGSKSITSNLFGILLGTAVSVLTIWYLQFFWRRRKLYKYSSKVPGPPAFPIIGSAHYFIGNPQDIFENVMWILKTYPGISRVWYAHRLFYTITTPEHLEIILNSPKALAKEELYKYAEPVVGKGLFTASVPQWKKHRKIIMPTFNQKILDKFVEVFSIQSEILVEQLKNYSGKGEIDIFHLITRCTLDIICETAMGVQVKAQTTDSKFGKLVDTAMEKVFLRMFVFWYHFDFIFNLTYHAKEFAVALKYLLDFTGKVVREKRIEFERKMKEKELHDAEIDEGNRRKAFLDYLLEVSTQGGQTFTDTELTDEVITFMIAGSDTTASSNCFVFTALGLYPDVQQKVYDEVIEVLGHDRNVEAADLPRLKYLERVIKEALRLFPVGAFIVRAIHSDLDLKDGNILPAGSSTVLGMLYTHRSEKYWPNPLTFNPDRFLPEEVAKRHPCTFIPFSYGPRNCIGPRYAMMAMKSLIATVVRSYKIGTIYKTIEEIELKTHLVLRPKDGYKVTLEARSSP